MSIQSARFSEVPSPPQSVRNIVDAQFNSLTMVPSIRGLMCSLDTVLLPFHLTRLNDVSLRFPVIQMDQDENIEKLMVETAGFFMNGRCCSRTNRSRLSQSYMFTNTVHTSD